jgi:hypothetical protein
MSDAPAGSVAALNTATGKWDTLAGGMRWYNGQPHVTAVAFGPDGFYAGGQFSQAGPHPSLGFAHYRGDFSGGPPPNLAKRTYVPLAAR